MLTQAGMLRQAFCNQAKHYALLTGNRSRIQQREELRHAHILKVACMIKQREADPANRVKGTKRTRAHHSVSLRTSVALNQ